jgi:soluble lytic murein transglycosylase-like protein
MKKEELQALAIKMSEEMGLRHDWVCAIIQIESNWDSWAVRYESHYKWLYKPAYFSKLNNITFETESVFQCTSFGAMQVMGAVARECGLTDSLLTLTRPDVGLKYGLLKFSQLLGKYNYTMDAIASYNAGSPRKTNGVYVNQQYVEKFKLALGVKDEMGKP